MQEYATNWQGKGKGKGERKGQDNQEPEHPVRELEHMEREQMGPEQRKMGQMRSENGGNWTGNVLGTGGLENERYEKVWARCL